MESRVTGRWASVCVVVWPVILSRHLSMREGKEKSERERNEARIRNRVTEIKMERDTQGKTVGEKQVEVDEWMT